MVDPYSSNFRVITTNCMGVQIFKKFTVLTTCYNGELEEIYPSIITSSDSLTEIQSSRNDHMQDIPGQVFMPRLSTSLLLSIRDFIRSRQQAKIAVYFAFRAGYFFKSAH